MGRFHYATSREPELSFFRIALPATVFRYQSLQRAGERTSLLLGIYNMLKNSPTESFFKKFFIFFSFTFRLAYARQIIQISAFSQQTQSSAASLYTGYSFPLGEQQKPLPVLCTSSGTKSSTGISLNLSRFLIFLHIFSSSLSLHRHFSESFSLGINAGWERRAERLQCPCRPVHPELVLFVSDCCCCRFVDKCKFVFKHIFFFLSVCSLVSLLLHIQYARILRCGYFFADFFVYEIFRNSDSDLACIQCTCCQAVFATGKRNRKAEHNARTGGGQSSKQLFVGCKFTVFH